ncbi:MAG: multicopper oxidase type 3 [Streptosporangiaceae bacterium]|nr:multicopper oxidase type 3 [Streptosporangiaceae bacterium]
MGLTRREFTRLAAAAGIGAAGLLDWTKTGGTVRLEKYVDPLPAIPVAVPRKSVYPSADYYELTMLQRPWRFHRDLGMAQAWGYWAANPAAPSRPIGLGYLGPTVVAQRHRPVVVRYRNELPRTHLLHSAVDVTLWKNLRGVPPDPPGGRMPRDFPYGTSVWVVPHLHGGFDAPQFDGSPEAWFTPQGAHGPAYASLTGARADEVVYAYSNSQRPTLLWYHDHAMAITRLNMYAGLAAPYVIRDEAEERLGLPTGEYEVPLVIQDRTFNPDGSLFYPAKGVTPYHPRWVPEFFGEVPIVNGKAYPFLAVEPRRYRLRILNASDARFYRMWFEHRGARLPFWLIGVDGGLRAEPVQLSEIFLAPAERADVIVDFGRVPRGAYLTVRNDAQAPFPTGGGPPMRELMRFSVTKALSGPDRSTSPDALELPAISPLGPTPGVPARELVLTETVDRAGESIHLQINRRFFCEAVEDTPRLGTTEIWEYVNTTEDAHPMHVHLVQFQVHNRQRADTASYKKDYESWVTGGRKEGAKPVLAKYLIGEPMPAEPQEMGRKDTFKAYPDMVSRMIATFDLPSAIPEIPGTRPRMPAEYVHHCHMLEHEDNEMMRPWQVTAG